MMQVTSTDMITPLVNTLKISVDLPYDSKGYVVIDSTIDETSSGGVRIVEDLSLNEISTLAREMTFKFSFMGLSRGGAKSGVRMDADLSIPNRIDVLEEFGRKLGPLIRSGLYYPGMDMNCGPEDLRTIYRGAGLLLSKKITDSSFFTAVSAANAIRAISDKLSVKAKLLTVAIEGFGSVGNYLAQRLPADKYRIVAISTIKGAVRKTDGIQKDVLASLRVQYGDDLIDHVPETERIDRNEILTMEVDVLVPCARSGVINHDNVSNIKARYIVPVANAPYADSAFDLLLARGVICLPGFVVNAGGVFASSLYDGGVTIEDIENLTGTSYRSVVSTLLDKSYTMGISPVKLAEEIAIERFRQGLAGMRAGGRRFAIYRRLFRKGLLPKRLFGKLWLAVFGENLKILQQQISEYKGI